MKKILFAIPAILIAQAAQAQTTKMFDFEALPLTGSDSDYVASLTTLGNYQFIAENATNKVEFNGRKESWGGFAGANYTNRTDSSNGTYLNDIAAITGEGYNNSTQYVTVYGLEFGMKFRDMDSFKLKGMYITNTTYTAKSIAVGDQFSEKFGGTSGNDADYYFVTFHGFKNGVALNDTINFYLADYRFADNSQDYVIKDWTWVDLSALAEADSISYTYGSSRSNEFGLLTPTYFSMDNLTFETALPTGINDFNNSLNVVLYPNPASDILHIKVTTPNRLTISVMDLQGKQLLQVDNQTSIDLSTLHSGTYFVKVVDNVTHKLATHTIIKK